MGLFRQIRGDKAKKIKYATDEIKAENNKALKSNLSFFSGIPAPLKQKHYIPKQGPGQFVFYAIIKWMIYLFILKWSFKRDVI